MFRGLRALLCGKAPHTRITLTPGRLYFLMSQELRQSRPKGRCMCHMPLPYAVEGDDGANWDARLGMLQCFECKEAAAAIVAKHRLMYDINLVELGDSKPMHKGGASGERLPFGGARAFG